MIGRKKLLYAAAGAAAVAVAKSEPFFAFYTFS